MAMTEVQFAAVAVVANPGGYGMALGPTVDGVKNTTAISGFSTPAGPITNSPTIDYTHATPHNRVRGVRIWNQCGSDLNDSDGIGQVSVEFFAPGLVSLGSGLLVAGNGSAPFTFLLPGELNNVERVRMTNITKISGSTQAPFWREFQTLEIQQVYACRTPGGVLRWHDLAGNQIANASVTAC